MWNKKHAAADVFKELQQEMRSQYAIGYAPTNEKRDGGFRRVELRTQITTSRCGAQRILRFRREITAGKAPDGSILLQIFQQRSLLIFGQRRAEGFAAVTDVAIAGLGCVVDPHVRTGGGDVD